MADEKQQKVFSKQPLLAVQHRSYRPAEYEPMLLMVLDQAAEVRGPSAEEHLVAEGYSLSRPSDQVQVNDEASCK